MARKLRSGALLIGAFLFASVVLATVAIVGGVHPASATSLRTDTVKRVIDGDTFELAGGARIRVKDFDTAELRNYDCAAERAMAQRARDTARDLLQGRRVTLTVDSKADRYGRLVAHVAVHRGPETFDFVERMVALGVGAHWRYGYEPQPTWCPDAAPATASIAEGVIAAIDWLGRRISQ